MALRRKTPTAAPATIRRRLLESADSEVARLLDQMSRRTAIRHIETILSEDKLGAPNSFFSL